MGSILGTMEGPSGDVIEGARVTLTNARTEDRRETPYIFGSFPRGSEQRSLQLRWEFYNLFNHTQFSGMDTTARFDSSTGAQVNGQFGWATSARTPRLMQASLRFRF
ncbi:MAG: hypothetical protein IT159_11655 [Bryobacterales bacterium]|nr:hypothetical protein [Bryobacterales bacterium]